ncbi:transcriptional regulatory protein LiaR [mine drainage metagenome]|uniref:Transcriptional regulatory protein LiaR n=1 Tax=mine drainage metagenome TaxID=410659 RepID=A0A1J5SH01_9ZZZZ
MLADDHRIMREALRSVLEQEPDIEVVAEAADGIEALRLADENAPDLVVMDIGMPGLDGIEVTRQLLKSHPAVKVVALSTYSDRRIAARMMEAGANGYVIKAAGSDELVRAMRAAVRGEIYLCPEIAGLMAEAGRLRSGEQRRERKRPHERRLGQREREVLQLLSDGKTADQIATHLNIATTTVEAHQRNIMRKLDVHSTAQLATYAILHGLIAS